MPIRHSLQILLHRRLSPPNLPVTVILMNSPLAAVMDDLTTTREAGTGVDDSSTKEAVDLDLPLGVVLLLSRPIIGLVVRFATCLATLFSATRVAILPLN